VAQFAGQLIQKREQRSYMTLDRENRDPHVWVTPGKWSGWLSIQHNRRYCVSMNVQFEDACSQADHHRTEGRI